MGRSDEQTEEESGGTLLQSQSTQEAAPRRQRQTDELEASLSYIVSARTQELLRETQSQHTHTGGGRGEEGRKEGR